MSVLLAAGVLVGATTALANPPGSTPTSHRRPRPPTIARIRRRPSGGGHLEVLQTRTGRPCPLPVPEPPIGGAKLAACGVVVADGMGAPPHKLTSAAWLVADMGTGEIRRQRPARPLPTRVDDQGAAGAGRARRVGLDRSGHGAPRGVRDRRRLVRDRAPRPLHQPRHGDRPAHGVGQRLRDGHRPRTRRRR